MHLGNGAITPECGVIALGVAAAGAGIAVASARGLGLNRSRAAAVGALGAAVFAAQLFNVQILPYSSVHLVGGALLAWLLSPALAVLTMSAILVIQAVLLGDGGLLALGGNIINMGLLSAAAVVLARRVVGANPEPTRSAVALASAAFLGTVAGAALIVAEISVGRTAGQLQGLGVFATQLISAHLVAGVLEAATSVAIVAAIAGWRSGPSAVLELSPARAMVVAAASLAVAIVSLPWFGLASSVPDTYEAAIAALVSAGSPLAQTINQLTGINLAIESWQARVASLFAGSEALLVVAATALAGAASWASARGCMLR